MTGRNFVTRMRRGIREEERVEWNRERKKRKKKKKERVWSNRPAYENFSDTEHPAPWFTIFHRNVTQGHSYPSGYCRALLVSQVRYFHLLISFPSSFIFLASFFFFASFFWLSRHTGEDVCLSWRIYLYLKRTMIVVWGILLKNFLLLWNFWTKRFVMIQISFIGE